MDLDGVTTIELSIVPDISGGPASRIARAVTPCVSAAKPSHHDRRGLGLILLGHFNLGKAALNKSS